MKVLGLTDQFSGCGYHRIQLPTAFLDIGRENKLITNDLSDEVFAKGWDIIFFNRYINDISIEQLKAYRAKYGFKIVVDIDDAWYLDPHHILYDTYQAELTHLTIQSLMIADLVTCTHERLAHECLRLNPNVEIIPNALPYGELQFTDNKTDSERTRFIYCGGITHERDVQILRNPLKRVYSSMNEMCEFILCGYDDSNEESEKIWKRMLSSFSYGGKLNGKVERGLPVDQYMNLYNNSDVSMIPLLDTTFNALKSNLKILEAAAKKNPAIVSHVDPYKEMPVRYVNNQTQWYDNIKFYAEEKEARIDDGERLYEYCLENFSLRKWSETRRQIFEHVAAMPVKI